MSRKTPWLDEIISSLKELGGQAQLSEIYLRIQKRNIIDLDSYKDWKSQIRKHIYLHSSDCDIFKGTTGDNSDKFYSIEGKGKGYWGLRDL
jgi:putative restriction endonuclease